MALDIRRVQYFYTFVNDRPGEAYKILAQLSQGEVNLLAFNAVPMGTAHTQLVLFPESIEKLAGAAETIGLTLTGPHHAILIQGDDELGALADVHARLYDAKVNVYASNGVSAGRGTFGYVIYIRADDFERAATSLGA